MASFFLFCAFGYVIGMVEQLIVRIRDKTGTVREVLTRKFSRALDFNRSYVQHARRFLS